MSHTYEEIRSATFSVLSGTRGVQYSMDDFSHLKIEVGRCLDEFDGKPQSPPSSFPADSALTNEDAETLGQVFWDLFRIGIVTLGKNQSNNQFPFFRVTEYGSRCIAEGDTYFIVDTTEFESRVRSEIPNLDDITMLYLRESFQAYRTGCLISSAVTLGVAAEHLFLLLIEQLIAHPTHSPRFQSVSTKRGILRKIEAFKSIAASDQRSFPQETRESFDTQLLGIQSMIRIYRNESGHPTGRVIDREQAFVNLRLFLPFGKMIHSLMDFYT